MCLITNQTKILCLALYMQNYRWSEYDAMHCKRMHHLNPIKQTCPSTELCIRVFATLLGNIKSVPIFHWLKYDAMRCIALIGLYKTLY